MAPRTGGTAPGAGDLDLEVRVRHPPTEPGDRCLRSVPWEAPSPRKPCRFITPENPFPLDTPTTSVWSPGAKMSTHVPVFAQLGLVSVESVALTVSAAGAESDSGTGSSSETTASNGFPVSDVNFSTCTRSRGAPS